MQEKQIPIGSCNWPRRAFAGGETLRAASIRRGAFPRVSGSVFFRLYFSISVFQYFSISVWQYAAGSCFR